MAGEAGFNWAYLTYDWGFPPEVEQADWQSFREAVAVYHAAQMRVFGYIQTSNYVVSGSFAGQDWYARDPQGRPFYYYTGRYMSCWLHPEWQQHLQAMVAGVVDAVEVYNGNWLGERFVTTAEQIAAQMGVARTGGSDAHVAGQLMVCYTELPDPVRSTADVVAALKQRRTVPHRPEARRKRRFGLF